MSGASAWLMLLVTAVLARPGAAQDAAPQPPPPTPPPLPGLSGAPQLDLLRRRQLGVLTFTRLTLRFDGTPAKEAFAAIRDRLGIPLIGRYSDDPVGHGIDPAAPMTLDATGEPARTVLEAMLRQCDRPGAPCTWQMRSGFVEFGTKERLNVPAARETRCYNIADLIIDVPEDSGVRTRREVFAMDMVQEIVETIEPGAWDWGQSDQPDDLPALPPAAPPETPAPTPLLAPAAPAEAPAPSETPPAAESPQAVPPAAASRPEWPPRRYMSPRHIAIIRYWRDHLVVHAPDYIHREINGYPEPIPPPGLGGSK